MNVSAGTSRRCPVAEHLPGRRERFLRGHVADDREDRVVRHEDTSRWNAIRSSRVSARDRLRRAGLRHAVRMKAVDEPIEHGVGDVIRDPRS